MQNIYLPHESVNLSSLLFPRSFETIFHDGKSYTLPKTVIQFKQWKGTPIANTFGGKPLVDFDGRPMFAELAVMKLFNISGWDARWIETYGASAMTPYHFTDWLECSLTEQVRNNITIEHILERLHCIATNNNNTYSGCWDVLGWHGERIVFAETKRARKDRFRSTQNQWLKVALESGLDTSNFMIVEWDFVS